MGRGFAGLSQNYGICLVLFFVFAGGGGGVGDFAAVGASEGCP